MKKYYNQTKKSIISDLNSNESKGLTTKQANDLLNKYGKNELTTSKKTNILIKFINQLKDFMVLVLIIAAIISSLTGDLYEGLFILIIVLINASLGVYQEEKAEKSLESIKKLSSPKSLVIRDNKEVLIDAKDIVVGDIVILRTGDFVPADLRIIESNNLKIDESSLTGESESILKTDKVINEDDLSLGDRLNLSYMGTTVTYGKGIGIVLKTGMNTEMGKITKMLNNSKKELTPLQKSINKLGKTLAIIALIITGLIFLIDIVENLIVNGNLSFSEIKDSFTFAIALAVAAIPEGLPAIITIVLSLGMTKLVKNNAIMKNLPSVETLGSTNIICSDKTGTLTLNEMTVKSIYYNNKVIEENNFNKDLEKLIKYSVLATDVSLTKKDDKLIKVGDPTELALINLAINNKIDPLLIKNKYEVIKQIPFDSKRKLMSVVVKIDGAKYLITKGAPEVLFKRVNYIEENNKISKTSQNKINNLNEINDKLANQALRVIGISYKKINNDDDIKENNLTFLGLIGMIDPERKEAKDSIKVCLDAGIQTVMITGDHKNTALKIAKNLNIVNSKDDLVITGLELDKMSDEEFLSKINNIKVYARVSPANKVRIVETFQSLNKVVAMTGDGVNDAPSIKKANIGIAMGITGTEVAKDSADMILTDDNFSTIVNAVSEGRAIFENIKKVIHFLLSSNIGEILVMFLGVSIGMFIFKNDTFNGHILTAIQILWVNLVTDSLMAIALGLEHKEPNIMNQKPRDTNKSIFADGLAKKIIYQGILIGLLSFISFTIGWFYAPSGNRELSARTMAFMVLSISQLFHAFNVRSLKHSTFKLKVNKHLIYAFIIGFILQIGVLITPSVRKLFNIELLNIYQIIIVLILSLIPLILIETIKYIKNKRA